VSEPNPFGRLPPARSPMDNFIDFVPCRTEPDLWWRVDRFLAVPGLWRIIWGLAQKIRLFYF